MRWFLLLIVSASAVWAQFPLPMPIRPTSFPLQRPSKSFPVLSAWGYNTVGQTNAPPVTDAVQISAGSRHALALRQNESIIGWGADWHGQTTVPPTIENVVQVSAGSDYSVALRSDGTAVLWGMTQWSGLTSWQSPIQPSGFTNLVQVSSSHWHTLGLKADGNVVIHGGSYGGNLNIPPGLSGVVQVAAGFYHCVVLRDNGTVVAWGGQNIQSGYSFSFLNYGQANVPADLTNVVEVAAGEYHSAALKSDGTVIVWGSNEYGQRDVPSDLSGVVSISSGARHVVAVRYDGTVATWGDSGSNLTPPDGLPFVTQTSAGQGYTIALAQVRAPMLVAEYPPGMALSNNVASTAHPATLLSNTSDAKVYTLRNPGSATLSDIVVSKSGDDSSHFLLTAPLTNSLAPGASTTFSVSFAPTSYGSRAAQLSITSNDTNNSPFVINLSGFGLSDNVDTDGDGLSDAWEAGLGRYQIVDGAFTWEQAQTDAHSKGGHLATVISQAEHEALLFALGGGASLTSSQYWLGGTDRRAEGSWEWSTGESSAYARWNGVEPNGGASENYLSVYGSIQGAGFEFYSFHWNDAGGWLLFPYILEIGYPTDPLNADSDGDGFNDKIESDNDSDPNSEAATPALTDRDNDGVNYYREIADGTNPTNDTSFNPLSRGLVAYYPFDENANDMSGYGNDGTVSGAMLTEDRIRPTSGAYVFDGIDDSITANDNSLPSGNAPRTMSVWVKCKRWDGPENAHVLNYGTQNNGTAFGFWHRDNVVSFYGGGFGDVDLQGAGLTTDTWEHLLVSYAADSVKVYRNGRFVIEQPRVLSTLLNLLVIGTAPSNDPNFSFSGAIDDIRIYNRSLTDAEIELLYYAEAFNQTQRDFLSSNPGVQGHFSLAQFNANRTNGQTDVTANPAAFNLFTQSQFDGNRTAGQQDVIASPMAYGLYDSNSIMDLRMGGLMIQKQGTDATIVFQPQTTTDLATLPFTNNGTPITNTVPMPEDKGFLRVEAIYVPAGELP
jgi:hypothetical protein